VRAASTTAWRLAMLASITVVLVVAPGHRLALAHDDDQLDTSPAAGETVQSVADIMVDFAGPVEGERFEVIDPAGTRVEGATSVTSVGVATFDPVAEVTGEGEYTVRYTALSADGHLVSGEFTFTVGADPPGGAVALRWIAGVATVIAVLSVAAAATIARRKRPPTAAGIIAFAGQQPISDNAAPVRCSLVNTPEAPDGTLSALPSVGVRVAAFAAICLSGLAGALIGYSLVSIQCDGDCTVGTGIGLLTGALIAAAGMAIVAVLVMRAIGEWREFEDRTGAGHAPR